MVRYKFFGSVAMVRIKIPYADASHALPEHVERRHHDVVEIAKPHRAFATGMMSGWPHQREPELSIQGGSGRSGGRSGRCHRVLVDVWVSRSIRIEFKQRLLDRLDMFRRMC